MQTEIEAKFLSVDHNTLRVKLQGIGAKCSQPMRLMRRYNFDFPDHHLQNERNGWVRVRDEGNKVTLSYKQLNDRTLHGTKEIGLKISSFEDAKLFLESIGLESTSYQETKRESWKLGDIEIELDLWPWTKPYIEIEAPSEESLREVVSELGLAWESAVHGSVEVVYLAEYDVTEEEIDNLPLIRFEDPVPEVLKPKRKKQ